MTIPLFTKRQYSFTADTTVPVVKAVDVSQYTEGALVVRVHEASISAGSLVVRARTTAPSPEEPSTDFYLTTDAAVVTFTSAAAAGDLGRGALSSDFGGFLRIEVHADWSSDTIQATLSADLVVKA
jgi:hypothetical protein